MIVGLHSHYSTLAPIIKMKERHYYSLSTITISSDLRINFLNILIDLVNLCLSVVISRYFLQGQIPNMTEDRTGQDRDKIIN